jgi:hypothetical protein
MYVKSLCGETITFFEARILDYNQSIVAEYRGDWIGRSNGYEQPHYRKPTEI